MPKSKTNKSHKERLVKYKANKKKEQELFKKKMIDNYIKMQEHAYASQEEHTSTQDVTGPEIDIDDLNSIDVEPTSTDEFDLGDLELTIDDVIETETTIAEEK